VGSHFPPSDDAWRDSDSIGLLERAATILGERGYQVVNVDVTVVCETPKIRPHAAGMADRLAKAMTVASDRVSIKGKTNEGLGWIGSGEGLAVHAVALIEAVDQ
jgi:2-C-methyl-D-erythritol 2,4-cyclodiphosphate synthase